ncbi:MAG: bifunctional adenosylcobinamide kinase/adenosylcobinamide-phosphate guanylyltransferase [Lentisphaeraceae bacterium]|nr:bifunctional adenosylcobinamide kinase/adenosylcobinamide-phosphate guanylyltransferase [Lentisphaeraceae bacterium]
MAKITLITGGCRSGKSTYAEKLMIHLPGPFKYIATAPNIDGEMDIRIRKHKQRREIFGWETIEEEQDLSKAIVVSDGCSVLVECLTLWINNLIYHAQQDGEEIDEDIVSRRCNEVVELAQRNDGNIIFVTNETGMGIMPENPTARLFGDLAGRCNQIFADAADTVYMMVSGIPMLVKGGENGKS